MVLLDKNYTTAISTYELLSKFEEEKKLKSVIQKGIYLIFVLSQSYPVENAADFFSDSNFAMMEAHHEFKSSYEITKFGFFKQGLMSLRSGLDLGVLSTYWSIVGKNDRTFKNWLRAREKTPFSNAMKKTLLTNPNIYIFNERYCIKDLFDKLGFLHNYVHTQGKPHSTYGEFKKMIVGEEHNDTLFEKWCQAFQCCVQLIVILHLLRFPIASLKYDFVKKFGSYNKSPFCGGLFGDFQEDLIRFIGQEKLNFIQDIAHKDDETVGLLEWLDSHPDLSQEEIDMIIAEEQREWEEQEKMLRQMKLKTE